MTKSVNALLCFSSAMYQRYVDHWQSNNIHIHHFPIDRFEWMSDSPAIKETLDNLEYYGNLVCSELDSTRQFLSIVEQADKLEKVKNKVCFAGNKEISAELEEKGIPAIEPLKENKAIDVVETMLRFRRTGPVLLPTRKNKVNDIAGFLEELEIEVNELPVYKKIGLDDKTIESYRRKTADLNPNYVFFHSREAVNSIPAVFKNIEFAETKNIALNKAVAQKMLAGDIPIAATLENELSDLGEVFEKISQSY